MCRLFGLSSTPRRTLATFWLLDAPDSLSSQSHREPDGTGLGYFDERDHAHVDKAPIAAYQDRAFAREARRVRSTTFLAHIRYASTGGLTAANTHPFEQHGRLFAHNGVIEGLDDLDTHLGRDSSLVHGDTDSERFFALITRETHTNGGDIAAGIESAVGWIARTLPVFALNFILTTAEELWALRYPDTHELYVLDRQADLQYGVSHLHHKGTGGRLRVHSAELADTPAVVIASERMDDDPRWRLLQPGELLHVSPGPEIQTRIALPDPPVHRLSLDDLHPAAAASQTAA
jgi:glutamine amidotransferase